MAIKEDVRVIRIDTSESINSISDLKAKVSEYRKELNECTIGSEEAKQKNIELREAQAQLTAAMNGAVDATGKLDNSYNGLVSQMAALKASWRAATDEAERAKLGAQIADINTQLKGMDASIGNFQRNVGNYTGAMEEAFAKVGINMGNMGTLFKTFANSAAEAGAKGTSAMSGLSAGAKGLGASLKALAANPVGVVIMGIVLAVQAAKAVFDAFKKSVEGNEVASDNMAKALAPLKAIIQTLTNVWDGFVESVTKGLAIVGSVVSGFMEFLGIGGEIVKLENEIADLQNSNNEEHRKILVENSKLELEASEARAKAADKEKYTAQERLAFAKEYAEKQKEIAANNLKEAQNELKLLEAQAATGANNEEMNNKLAEATAKLNNVQKAYNDTLRSTNKELANINKEIASDAAAKQKEKAEASKKWAEEVKKVKTAYEGVAKALKEATQTETQNKIDEINEKWNDGIKKYTEYAQKTKQTEEWLNAQIKDINEVRAKQIAEVYTELGDKIKAANEEVVKYFATDKDQYQIDKLKADLEKEKEAYIKLLKEDSKYTKEYIEEQSKLRDKYIEESVKDLTKKLKDSKLSKDITEAITPKKEVIDELKEKIIKAFSEGTIDEEKARKLFAQIGLNAEVAEKIVGEIKEKLANVELSTNLDGVAKALEETAKAMSAIISIGEGIDSEWANVFGNLSDGFAQVAKNIKDGKKGWEAWSDMAVMAAQAASSAMIALANEQDDTTEEGFKKQKGYQIAAATMSMLAGITAAISGLFTTKSGPWDIALAAIQASTIAATGAIQISKIAQMQFDKNGGSGTSVSPSISGSAVGTVTTPITFTDDLGIPSLTDSINNKEIWVSVSEIESTRNKVRVAETESRF